MKYCFLFVLLNSFIFSQDTLFLSAEYIPNTDTVLIFTPQNYDALQGYPLVYLLHGWSGDYNQWNSTSGGLQVYADKYQFIIVCPDGFYDSWYVDNPFKENMQWEKHFWNDITPSINEKYNVDKSKIFISGLSMGGHGAITLFLKRPDFFLSAGSTSGILDLTFFADRWSIKSGVGSYEDNSELWENNSAYYLLKNIEGTDKQFIFDCGRDDFAYEVNERFNDKCDSLKIKATFISQPGNHKHEYWKKTIQMHFDFFNNLLKN